MLRNFMLTLAYDGTDFHGWQLQPDLRTVQSCLEQAVRRLVRHQVTVIGCSRTDAGVHALGYVANFFTATPIPATGIQRGVGSRLPKDMSLIRAEEVPLTFHATRSAQSKLYRYRVHNTRGRPVETLSHRYTYHLWQPLAIDAMLAAADFLIGTHDFTSYASPGNDRETNVRTIHRIDIYRHGEEVRFDVEGDGFLYKQVRNMVGSLIEVGRGLWQPERVRDDLAACNRQQVGGPTAPARGLCLQWVRYDLPNLPEPSAELLEQARSAKSPIGMDAMIEDPACEEPEA